MDQPIKYIFWFDISQFSPIESNSINHRVKSELSLVFINTSQPNKKADLIVIIYFVPFIKIMARGIYPYKDSCYVTIILDAIP